MCIIKFDFEAAKFGMFIHWGLYSAIAQGEWYMFSHRVPIEEYAKTASEFNPISFNARDWVSIARLAGMKYIVITAKHHDGFAMFDSKADSYNIVKRTPFGRDPIRELQEECEKQGIQLCFYYSHVIDWHHPHALHESANNDWDYDIESKDFYSYWNKKAKPQVRELLENYGRIGLLWLDTAGDLSEADSLDMYRMVKSIQPSCLVNSRLSHVPDMGDYSEKGDNEIPLLGADVRHWQTPMTLNQSWGYEEREQNWKESKLLVYKLINIISKGGNMLLNVGPRADGVIPAESVDRLKEIGSWICGREESIYNTEKTPFPYEHEWGGITAKGNMLYLHIFNEYINKEVGGADKRIFLAGLNNAVKSAYILTTGQELSFKYGRIEDLSLSTLDIWLPESLSDKYAATVALELDDTPITDQRIIQQNRVLYLDMPNARIIESSNIGTCEREENAGVGESVRNGDCIENQNTAEWDFIMLKPGEYSVWLINFKKFNVNWDYPEVSVLFEGQEIKIKPSEDHIEKDSQSCQHPYHLVQSHICNIKIDRPGKYTISLKGHLVGKRVRGFEAWQAPEYRLRSLLLSRN